MLSIINLFPLRSVVVTLRFLQTSNPSFFHQPALGAFLRYLAGGPEGFERLIRFDAPESGRIAYQPGQFYRFTLVCLAGGEKIFNTLLGNLARLPGSSPQKDRPLPFRNNCALAALHDSFTAEAVTRFDELCAYEFASLQQEAELWRGYDKLTWHTQSPVRLLKAKERRTDAKGEARYCRNLSDVDGALLSARLYDSMAELLRSRGVATPPRPPAPPLLIDQGHLFWLDADYTDAVGERHVIGGMNGRLELAFPELPPVEWLQWAICGQYTGLGQRVAFGLGRYQLQAPDTGVSCRRALPAASLLMLAREEDNLVEAWRHVVSKQELARNKLAQADVPDDSTGEFYADDPALTEGIQDEIPLERLQQALDKALLGSYHPPPLRGVVHANPDGSLRPLAVPPFIDRVLQRAVGQILTPALESCQYCHSYGYRAGRSRMNARDAVQSAIRQGYQWVYESDIDDFFDSVAYDRLDIRLRSLYGEDPVVGLLQQWVSCPVEFDGQTIQRKAGLPQGSPLSPALANLMLDDFDGDMEVLGFRLIRFADDFVVLCKNEEQARQAHNAATASLAEHGLSLNPDKTRIAEIGEGFRYLGYLFVNDLAVDVSGHKDEIEGKPSVPPNSWLARLGGRTPLAVDGVEIDRSHGLRGNAKADAPRQTPPERCNLHSHAERGNDPTRIGEMGDMGQLLCVVGGHATLSTHAGRLRVERDGETQHDVAWNNLQAVVLFGSHTLTTPALQAALARKVPIHFAGSTGGYRGVLWTGQPAEPGSGLWLKQANLFADPALCLNLAKQIVDARIRHLRETLRQRGITADAERLKLLLASVANATGLDELNGVEGSATRQFFQALQGSLPTDWHFTGRNRQPPLDPFNALLSYGYTLLHGYVETLLHTDGLLPWLGFYHQAHGRHATLASDLMEPFRHLVERTALSCVQRKELKPHDFFTAANGACLMKQEARRDYLASLFKRLNEPLQAVGEETPVTPVQHIHRQNLSLIGWLMRGDDFHAWRIR